MPGLRKGDDNGAGDDGEGSLEEGSPTTVADDPLPDSHTDAGEESDDDVIREVLDTEGEDSGASRYSPYVEIGNKKVRHVGFTKDVKYSQTIKSRTIVFLLDVRKSKMAVNGQLTSTTCSAKKIREPLREHEIPMSDLCNRCGRTCVTVLSVSKHNGEQTWSSVL